MISKQEWGFLWNIDEIEKSQIVAIIMNNYTRITLRISKIIWTYEYLITFFYAGLFNCVFLIRINDEKLDKLSVYCSIYF